ncbi:MAG TPA: DUF3617 domain-containing protein [Rhizomicrobium sp.]|jgi:hypothetical protein
MIWRKIVWQAALAMAVVGLPVAAQAGHIRAGLWEVTTHVDMHNMEAMIPPEQLARMKAMGMHMPGDHTASYRHCVTAEDAANDKPPPMHNKDCAMSNMIFNAHAFSADLVCTGEHQAQGHVSVAFDGDQHYSGSTKFNVAGNGGSMGFGSSFEGRWISAACGSVD